jgi:hypothetical protein
MRKSDNRGTIDVDNSEQTGTRGEDSVCRVFRTPVGRKCGDWSGFEIECEKLCELLHTKWTRSSCNTLKKAVGIISFLFVDFFQTTCICLVQCVWGFLQSTLNASRIALAEADDLTEHPTEPTIQT